MYYTSKKYKLFTVHEREQCEHVNVVNVVKQKTGRIFYAVKK